MADETPAVQTAPAEAPAAPSAPAAAPAPAPAVASAAPAPEAPAPAQAEAPQLPLPPSPVVNWSEFKIPKGLEFSEEFQNDFIKAANNPDPRVRGQEMFDLHKRHAEKIDADAKAAREKQREDWRKEIKSNPEYGGAKLPEARTEVEKFFAQHDVGEKLQGLLESTSLGDHPVVFDFVYRMAKAMNEPAFIAASNAATASKPWEDRMADLYKKNTPAARMKAAA